MGVMKFGGGLGGGGGARKRATECSIYVNKHSRDCGKQNTLFFATPSIVSHSCAIWPTKIKPGFRALEVQYPLFCLIQNPLFQQSLRPIQLECD